MQWPVLVHVTEQYVLHPADPSGIFLPIGCGGGGGYLQHIRGCSEMGTGG